MKFTKILSLSYLSLAMVGGFMLTSCEDAITVATTDESKFELADGPAVYLADKDGKRNFTTAEFTTTGTTTLTLVSNENGGSVTVSYDLAGLEKYNKETGNNYSAMPQSLVTLGNGGNVSAGGTLDVVYSSSSALQSDVTYVIPLKVTAAAGTKVADRDAYRLIFVKDMTGLGDCIKIIDGERGVKVFSCMEVNNTNPLNNLCFTLANSGKYLVDAVILFSSNVNYDKEAGKPYIYHNENVQAILDNREHYLKPLQDRGMKVYLSLLCNHDNASVANMQEATAKEFAKEVKATCDAYQLDGVFYDCEYCSLDGSVPGFDRSNSYAAASRLMYEVKKLQPERDNIAYAYSYTGYLYETDGVQPGEFCDYGLHDYGGSADLSSRYPGMPKSNMGLYSQEFAQGRTASETNLKKMRDNGYGSHMIFSMDPNYSNFQGTQLPAMQRMARAFYDDELVWNGVKYSKDW